MFHYTDPTKNEAGTLSFAVPCKCSLSKDPVPGKNEGFCETVIGTVPYEKGLTYLKSMHEKAFKCHTLDRDNIIAQLDCNTEASQTVPAAADQKFAMENWPYVQDPEVSKCFKQISKNWLENVIALEAVTKCLQFMTLTISMFMYA